MPIARTSMADQEKTATAAPAAATATGAAAAAAGGEGDEFEDYNEENAEALNTKDEKKATDKKSAEVKK